MNSPTEQINAFIDFGLVLASFVLAWLVAVLLGGWKFGNLLKRIELVVDRAQLGGFMDRLHRRVAELGFKAGTAPGQYLQGGSAFEHPQDFGAFTHAKTSKRLDIALDHSAPETVKVQLSLQYLDPILGDTGESAYRDAVLDYISGQIEKMKVVPNRSFAAVATFVGGLISWVVLIGFKSVGHSGYKEHVVVLGGTYGVVGLVSIVAVSLKRGQSKGIVMAAIGAVASASAIVAAFLWR